MTTEEAYVECLLRGYMFSVDRYKTIVYFDLREGDRILATWSESATTKRRLSMNVYGKTGNAEKPLLCQAMKYYREMESRSVS